jgi:tRNA uridine 5-carbamoylmethylation protein Kti12
MNILLIGNICSGKSTVTKEMIKQIGHPTFTYAIDKIRNEIGNGKFSGEFKAWSHFLMKLEDYSDKSIYTDNRNGIFECSGTGRNCWYVQQILETSLVPWHIIYCSAPREVLLKRFEKRGVNVIIPYKLDGIESSVDYMSEQLRDKYTSNYWKRPQYIIDTTKDISVEVKRVLEKIKNEHGI